MVSLPAESVWEQPVLVSGCTTNQAPSYSEKGEGGKPWRTVPASLPPTALCPAPEAKLGAVGLVGSGSSLQEAALVRCPFPLVCASFLASLLPSQPWVLPREASTQSSFAVCL